MDENPEFETLFIDKCTAMPVEEMGIFLIRCLKQLTGERRSRKPVSNCTATYVHLFQVFLDRANSHPQDSPREKAQFDRLVDLWKSLEKKFDEACGVREYIPLPRKGPKRTIYIYDRGRRAFRRSGKCFDCQNTDIEWSYDTSIGSMDLCSECNERLRAKLGPKPVDMWSKMIFSAFESNRRKH